MLGRERERAREWFELLLHVSLALEKFTLHKKKKKR